MYNVLVQSTPQWRLHIIIAAFVTKEYWSHTYSERHEPLWHHNTIILIQETHGIKPLRIAVISLIHMHAPPIHKHPCALGNRVPVDLRLLSRTARDAKQRNVTASLTLHQRRFRVRHLLLVSHRRLPTLPDDVIDLALHTWLDVGVAAHEEQGPLEGGGYRLGTGDEEVLDAALQVAVCVKTTMDISYVWNGNTWESSFTLQQLNLALQQLHVITTTRGKYFTW